MRSYKKQNVYPRINYDCGDIIIIDPKNKHHRFHTFRIDKYGMPRTYSNGLWQPAEKIGLDIHEWAFKYSYIRISNKDYI